MMKIFLALLIATVSCQEIVTQRTYEATVNPQPCPIGGDPLLDLSYQSPRNCSATFCNFRPFPYQKDYRENCDLASGSTFPASYVDRLNFVKFRYWTGNNNYFCNVSNAYEGQIGIYEDKCTPDAFNQGVTFLLSCATPGISATLNVCPPNSQDCNNCQSYNVLADGQCHSFVAPGFPPGLEPSNPNARVHVNLPLTPDGMNTFQMTSYQMTCPKRYRKLSFWTDLPNCNVQPFPNTEILRRISHLGETGCDTTIPPQRCESFPLNDPDPLHAYGRKLGCLQEFSEYTPPPGYAMFQMWCTDPDCPQGDTPDIVRVAEPGKCSGASDNAGQLGAAIVRPIMINCNSRTVTYYSDSDCTNALQVVSIPGTGSSCGNFGGVLTQEPGCSVKSYKLTCPPTAAPTLAPSKAPTKSPTPLPTANPTKSPTKAPTKAPTKSPTPVPTPAPSRSPTTFAPTKSPTTPWHGDVTCVKGICNCDNAENCYCRGNARDCMCQESRNCYCENVSGFCFGGKAQNIYVDIGNNVDCELAVNCVIRTVPPNATSGASSVVVSVVLFALVLVLTL